MPTVGGLCRARYRSGVEERSGNDMWAAVHRERHALVAELQDLSPTQWGTASLCPGWNVHDVVAHLVESAKCTRLGFLRDMIAARFDFDRQNANGLAREKREDPRDTLAALSAAATNTATPPAPLPTRLVEVFVHGEDIRRPLGLSRAYPAAHVATALAFQVKTAVGMGGGRERAKGWRLTATDTPYATGEGAEVRGTAIALLLAVSGRPTAAGELSGAGAEAFLAQRR